jgi:hypothetical protein
MTSEEWSAEVLAWMGAVLWMICVAGLVGAFVRLVWWGLTGG